VSPFVFGGTDMVLEDRLLNPTDRATVLQINARHRPCVFPLREQLSELKIFFSLVNNCRAFALFAILPTLRCLPSTHMAAIRDGYSSP
jgi:hypothetical protein